MADERCQHWEVAPCCDCSWLAHTNLDTYAVESLPREGDLSCCAESCDDGEAHRYREGRRCARPDTPPLVPSWTHEHWTGHAFVRPERSES